MTRFIASLLIAFIVVIASADANSVDSSAFNPVTDGAISTTGALDWGYVSVLGGFFDSNLEDAALSYNDTPFGGLTKNDGTVLTTVSGSSSIGSVTLTEGLTGTNTVGAQNNTSNYSFDGSTAFGSYGNLAPGEDDAWVINFNDLGIGTFDITLYMGHTATNRSFEMDVILADATPVQTLSGQVGTLGSTVPGIGANGASFTYDITVSTTTADADLTLTFGDAGGGSFGGVILAGYTVTEGGGDPTPLAGDFNGDGTVDAADYTIYADSVGQVDESAFAPGTGDGMNGVDPADYALWRDNFGRTTPPMIGGGNGAVPEPGTVALLGGLSALAIAACRRR